MRLTVAADTPTSAAICLPVWRCRRKTSTAAHVAGGVWLGNERGLEERSRNPSTPSARNRSTHLATVFAVVLNRTAAAAFVRPSSITLRTIASRPFGVRGAFLWVSIRFSPRNLKLQQPQLPRSGPNGQPPESSHLGAVGRRFRQRENRILRPDIRRPHHRNMFAGILHHDRGRALVLAGKRRAGRIEFYAVALDRAARRDVDVEDRKSTRLNSSHRCISYAVFC